MKSREGTVVDADYLIEQVQKLVKKELIFRNKKLSKKEIEKRSLKISLAAIKYFLLKTDIKRDILFNPSESIKFDGDTGPYLLYSYARASSILRKIPKKKKNLGIEIDNLNDYELELVKKIFQFREFVEKAYISLNPSLIAQYSYQLSKKFNEFYHVCPVINSKEEGFRLNLVAAFKQILKNSLYLLGIEILEEM